MLEGDELEIRLNGVPVTGVIDSEWKDKELRPLREERVSGFHTELLEETGELFTRIVCAVAPRMLRRGENVVTASIRRASGYPYCAAAELERVEIAVVYKKQ